jgi:hypothetical protein
VDLESLSRLLTAAALSELLVAGISFTKTLVDGFDVGRACRHHATTLFPTAAAPIILTDDAVVVVESLTIWKAPVPSECVEEEASDDRDDFLCFPVNCSEVVEADEGAEPHYGGGIRTANEIIERSINDLLRLYGEQ